MAKRARVGGGKGGGESRSGPGRAVRRRRRQDLREVSASSSFFLLIRSFKPSASRRACWMRACIASGETSGRCESIVGVA